jgi:hypothetical protein
MAYFGTRLFKIEDVGGKLLITFKGGIEAIVDAIIGADGIQVYAWKHIPGEPYCFGGSAWNICHIEGTFVNGQVCREAEERICAELHDAVQSRKNGSPLLY